VASGKGAGPAAAVQGMLEECDRCDEDPLMFVVTEEGKLEAKVRTLVTTHMTRWLVHR